MSKVMQNLVILMEPSEHACLNDMKTGNMILNRFCIDEDAAFELSGVNYLKKSSEDIISSSYNIPIFLEFLLFFRENPKFKVKRIAKGKAYSFLRSYFISRNFICMNN